MVIIYQVFLPSLPSTPRKEMKCIHDHTFNKNKFDAFKFLFCFNFVMFFTSEVPVFNFLFICHIRFIQLREDYKSAKLAARLNSLWPSSSWYGCGMLTFLRPPNFLEYFTSSCFEAEGTDFPRCIDLVAARVEDCIIAIAGDLILFDPKSGYNRIFATFLWNVYFWRYE